MLFINSKPKYVNNDGTKATKEHINKVEINLFVVFDKIKINETKINEKSSCFKNFKI